MEYNYAYQNQLMCVICKRQIRAYRISNSSHYDNQVFKIFGVYSIYLKERFSKSYEWENLSEIEKKSPFCTDCFSSGEKLCTLDDQLKDIKKEIEHLLAKILPHNDDSFRNFKDGSYHPEIMNNMPDNSDLNDFYSNIGFNEDSFDPENNETVEMKMTDPLESSFGFNCDEDLENSLPDLKEEIPELKQAYVLLEKMQSNYKESLRKRRHDEGSRTNKLRRDITTVSKKKKDRKQKFELRNAKESEEEEDYQEINLSPNDKATFECNSCEAEFTTENKLNFHINRKHKLRRGKTVKAIPKRKRNRNQKLRDTEEVKRNKEVESNEDPSNKPIFECVPCEATFPTEAALNIHITKHGNKALKCNICGKTFHTKWIRRAHKLKVHGIAVEKRAPTTEPPKSYKKCEICGQESFTSKYDYEVHALAHNEEIPFQCQFCLAMFSNIDEYEKHQVHSDCPVVYRSEPESFPCDWCEKTFKAKYILIVHMSADHHAADKGYDCTVCQKKFMKIHNLEVHAARHTLECQFMCDICGMSLRGHTSLSEHRYTHKTTASFACKDCNSGFKTRNALARHSLIHGTPGKTSKCDHCGMELKNKTDLKRHVATHFKNIICDVCGKAYNRNVDLKTHYRIHTGELFACTSCNRKFVSQYLLTQHVASVHLKIKSKSNRVIKSRVKRSVETSISSTENTDMNALSQL